MSYSNDDVVYVIAIRSAGPKNGDEVKAALQSIREHVDPVCDPRVIAKSVTEATARDHDLLRDLGFDFRCANSIFPVVTEAPA